MEIKGQVQQIIAIRRGIDRSLFHGHKCGQNLIGSSLSESPSEHSQGVVFTRVDGCTVHKLDGHTIA